VGSFILNQEEKPATRSRWFLGLGARSSHKRARTSETVFCYCRHDSKGMPFETVIVMRTVGRDNIAHKQSASVVSKRCSLASTVDRPTAEEGFLLPAFILLRVALMTPTDCSI
jgi:hypothetical protein